MSQTVLQVIQDAASEMGLVAPTSAAGNTTDLTAQQLLALYNALGKGLVRRRVWRQLFTEYTFPTVVSTTSYALPADWSRSIPQTEWDRTSKFPLRGPASAQQYEFLKSAGITANTLLTPHFKLIGGNLVLTASPTDVRTLAYCYVRNTWVTAVDGTTKKIAATVDTDTCVFDDRLMVAGLKLKFYQAKGFDTTMFAADFQVALDDAASQDEPGPVLSLAAKLRSPLISIDNLPEGDWLQ